MDALVRTVDVLAERANPKRLIDIAKEKIDIAKEKLQEKLSEPRIKYTLIGVGALVGLLLLRKLLR